MGRTGKGFAAVAVAVAGGAGLAYMASGQNKADATAGAIVGALAGGVYSIYKGNKTAALLSVGAVALWAGISESKAIMAARQLNAAPAPAPAA